MAWQPNAEAADHPNAEDTNRATCPEKGGGQPDSGHRRSLMFRGPTHGYPGNLDVGHTGVDRGSVAFALRCRCLRPRSGPADGRGSGRLCRSRFRRFPEQRCRHQRSSPGRYGQQPSRRDYWHSAEDPSGRSEHGWLGPAAFQRNEHGWLGPATVQRNEHGGLGPGTGPAAFQRNEHGWLGPATFHGRRENPEEGEPRRPRAPRPRSPRSPMGRVASVTEVVAPVTNVVAPVPNLVAPVTEVVAPVTNVVAPVPNLVAPVTEVVAPITDGVASVPILVAPGSDAIASVQDISTSVAGAVPLTQPQSDLSTFLVSIAGVGPVGDGSGGIHGAGLSAAAGRSVASQWPVGLPHAGIPGVSLAGNATGVATLDVIALGQASALSGMAPLAPERAIPMGVESFFQHVFSGLLLPASLWALATMALPGVAGLMILTAAGVRVGYRQAKAGFAVRAAGTARFGGLRPSGVVRPGSLVVVVRPRALRVIPSGGR